MNKELTKNLIKKYPFYLRDKHYFIFECDDGWYDMLEELSEKIQKIIDTVSFYEFSVSQVKEKFGTLRYYTFGSMPEIDALIEEYEDKSQFICEICGEKGNIKKVGGLWLKTLCDKHYQEITK